MFKVEFIACSEETKSQFVDFIDEWEKDITFITVQTSGSTGAPKQLQLTKEQCIHSARRTNDYFKLNENSTALIAVKATTIAAKMMLIRAMEGNYSVIITEPSLNPLRTLIDQKIDFIPLVPSQLTAILNENPTDIPASSVILLGGSAPNNVLLHQIQTHKLNVFIGFGMTETVSHIAIRPYNSSIYTALQGVTFQQKESCLVVNDSVLGIEKLITTDEVVLLNDQQFEWLGRSDFAVNSGGVKLLPEYLEKIASPYVQGQFIFMGELNDQFGEQLVLVLDEHAEIINQEALENTLKEHFSKYAVPKKYIRFPFPSVSYKLNRKQLIQSIKAFYETI